MTHTSHALRPAAEALREGFAGAIVTPDDDSYDAVRRLWNGAVDRHPALIARCRTADDVVAALRFAREHDLVVAVRGGGHSVPGHSGCDGGLMIDLQPMKGVHVDAARREAVAQPGLTWGEFDRATQEIGLATTGGEVSTTGIAGLTLGGGVGWLKRVHGMTCDNLLAAEVVTADGRVVRASAAEEPELFWGLQGGGGNFGIVTEFRYRLHPVPVALGGSVIHPLERAAEALGFLREIAAGAPDELSVMAAIVVAPPAPFVPAELQGRPVVILGAWYLGSIDAGERALTPLRRFGPPAVEMIHPIPYVELQQFVDEACPAGLHYYAKSEMLSDLTGDVIDAAIDYGSRLTSPLSQILLHQLGGRMARVGRDDTAFPHRDAAFMATICSAWEPDDQEPDLHVRWARDLWTRMLSASTGGVYVNHLGIEGQERIRQAYGDATYARLARLKATWDPDNVFRLNQNITPA